MFRIVGKHSIVAAESNKNRKNKTFFGSKEFYELNNLSCKFVENSMNFLQVSEIFVQSSLNEIFNLNRIIILDGLEDQRNIGSIIRTAAILGFGVLVRERKGAPINEVVAKCASGGLDKTMVSYIKNGSETLKKIKANGFVVFALDEKGTIEQKIFPKIALIIGAEGNGVSYLMKKNCDFLLRLKGNSDFCTYNASAASSIAMYYFQQ